MLPLLSARPAFTLLSIHQMAPPLTEVKDIQLLLTTHIWTQKNERLSWPGWLTYIEQCTHMSGHTSDTGRAQNRESLLARD